MPTSIAVQIREGAHEFNIDLTTTLLIGRVVDQDGAPVAGARVSVAAAADAANREVTQAMKMAGQMFDLQLGGKQGPTTDDNGSFELRGASADQPIHVRIDASGFAPAVSAEIKLAKGETRRGIDFKLRAGGSVRVRVAGKAVAMAAVRAIYDGPEQNVDPVIGMMQGGACTLKGLVPGKWKISVTGFARAGKSSTPQIVEVKAGETTRVTMEQ
jgi:hypothetical protein